ncbi:MAG: hypothetical protein LBR57_02105 [Alistipes sp.]|jgi:stress-induced morphogen|nr:hypothetical protein [Alistipes sp.]
MKNLLTALAIIAAMTACGDIFETDISSKNVAVVAPLDQATITEGLVSFNWDALDGADKYRVTIVSPDFQRSSVAIRDTILYQDSLSLSLIFGFGVELAPADYQWRIQAFNGAYRSMTATYGLTVVPKPVPTDPDDPDDPDISTKKVAIVAPVDKTEITEGVVPFRWNKLDGASRYRVTVVSPDFEHARVVVKDEIVDDDPLLMSYGIEAELTPANYQWSVQAFNKTYESVRSVYDLKIVEQEEPEEPEEPETPDTDISEKRVSIVAPVDKTEITEGVVSFRWNKLDGASRYRVTVVSPDFEHARVVVKDEMVDDDPLLMSYGIEAELTPANYQWSVQAFNDTYGSARSVYNLTVVEPEQPEQPEEPEVPEIPDTDISGEKISIIAPVDKTEISEGRVTFRWDGLDGAEKYRITIVAPDFENARVVVKDEVIYEDPLVMSYGVELELAAGKYQWSVRAFNETYKSIRSVYDLTVKSNDSEDPETTER